MTTVQTTLPIALEPGHILVSPLGRVRVLRSRTATDDGWNCGDGAPVPDAEANDPERWTAYSPERLVASLELASQVEAISDQPVLAGGLRTWDACSGRPCILPRLAHVAREHRHHHPV